MKSILTTITFLFISIIAFGQNSEFAKLDSFFKVLEENDRFFGSVAVSRGGEIIYSNAIGYADVETKIPNTIETKFRIGSITKTFTATLIMKAVEMNKINLDNTIESYFPKIQNADKITVRHLLNHRSGINTFTDRDYFSWYTKPITRTELTHTIVDKGIDFEPDAEHVYSNSNYVLLTFILEDVFNQSFAQILEEHIIEPLNLKSTSYGGTINPTQKDARSYRMNSEWDLAPETHMSVPLGAGAMVSNPTDLCLFAEALFSGKLISTRSLQQMKPVEEEEYGFALYGTPIEDWNGWGHGGDIDGFTSSLSYFEEYDLCFALTCNGVNYGKHDIAVAALNEVFGKEYELPKFEFIELDSEELDQYLGTYESDELPIDLTISKEGNKLFGKGSGQASFPLLAEGDHKFSYTGLGLKMIFIPNENRLQFEQGGLAFEMTLKQLSKFVNLENEKLDQYLGTYESDELPMDLTISKEGNSLIGQGTGQPSFPLVAMGNHVFSNKEIGLIITFSPKEKKMKFEQSGLAFEMTLKQSVKSIESNKEGLDQYLGTYESDKLPMDLTISKEGNSLIGQGTGQPSFPLVAMGNHVFSNKEIGLTITFLPEEKKMNFGQGGAAFEMKLKQ